jgi:hypothetical protein
MNMSWPLVVLQADSQAVQLRVLFTRVVIPRASIQAIEPYRGIFSTGVRFHHTAQGVRPFVVFWTTLEKELLNALQELGYPAKV